MSYSEMEKQSMIRQLQRVTYCKICGQPVLREATKESGWESENKAHWECFRKEARKHGINV